MAYTEYAEPSKKYFHLLSFRLVPKAEHQTEPKVGSAAWAAMPRPGSPPTPTLWGCRWALRSLRGGWYLLSSPHTCTPTAAAAAVSPSPPSPLEARGLAWLSGFDSHGRLPLTSRARAAVEHLNQTMSWNSSYTDPSVILLVLPFFWKLGVVFPFIFSSLLLIKSPLSFPQYLNLPCIPYKMSPPWTPILSAILPESLAHIPAIFHLNGSAQPHLHASSLLILDNSLCWNFSSVSLTTSHN